MRLRVGASMKLSQEPWMSTMKSKRSRQSEITFAQDAGASAFNFDCPEDPESHSEFTITCGAAAMDGSRARTGCRPCPANNVFTCARRSMTTKVERLYSKLRLGSLQ